MDLDNEAEFFEPVIVECVGTRDLPFVSSDERSEWKSDEERESLNVPELDGDALLLDVAVGVGGGVIVSVTLIDNELDGEKLSVGEMVLVVLFELEFVPEPLKVGEPSVGVTILDKESDGVAESVWLRLSVTLGDRLHDEDFEMDFDAEAVGESESETVGEALLDPLVEFVWESEDEPVTDSVVESELDGETLLLSVKVGVGGGVTVFDTLPDDVPDTE